MTRATPADCPPVPVVLIVQNSAPTRPVPQCSSAAVSTQTPMPVASGCTVWHGVLLACVCFRACAFVPPVLSRGCVGCTCVCSLIAAAIVHGISPTCAQCRPRQGNVETLAIYQMAVGERSSEGANEKRTGSSSIEVRTISWGQGARLQACLRFSEVEARRRALLVTAGDSA